MTETTSFLLLAECERLGAGGAEPHFILFAAIEAGESVEAFGISRGSVNYDWVIAVHKKLYCNTCNGPLIRILTTVAVGILPDIIADAAVRLSARCTVDQPIEKFSRMPIFNQK